MTHLDQESVSRRSISEKEVYKTTWTATSGSRSFQYSSSQHYGPHSVYCRHRRRTSRYASQRETAITYAKAGASVTVVGRSRESLDKTAAAIRAAVSEAHVLAYPADVRDPKALEAAVQATLERFGRLDVLIANAGALSNVNQKLGDKDPERWWNTFEVNIRGVYNTVRASLSALEKTSGRIVIVSSSLAQLRFLLASDYAISKHALNRLVEFIALEYPKLTVFALHPGSVKTQMAEEAKDGYPDGMVFDAVQLPAATMLYLTSGRLDWLNGKYSSANWDIAEIERDWKEKVQGGNALVSKLAIPK